MRKIREILRLRLDCQRPHSEIAASCTISPSTVSDYLRRFERSGLTWPEATRLSDVELEARLFCHRESHVPPSRAPIDCGWVHKELRGTGVTLQLLWTEYTEAARGRNDGSIPYGYSQFCELYRLWSRKLAPTMRQVHRAGEKAFIDYSGKRPHLIDPSTGERRDVELFVMVLGASNYTYAEATFTQRLGDFVASTIRGLEYFGATPQVLVPDQLRSAVTGPDRYEPDINATYSEMAKHYGVAVVPARPRRPRDKAKVEGGVLLVQRWILACLRKRRFSSLEDLNVAISELLERLNDRPFQKMDGSRRSIFEELDRPSMGALPVRRYELAIRKDATVNIDYHISYDDRLYSVPHTLIQKKVSVRATTTCVEVFYQGDSVAMHTRSYGPKGSFVTQEAHRPRNHIERGRWTPERMVAWGASFGPAVARVVELTLARHLHPEMGYRACLGLLRCAERYGNERMEAACAKALPVAGEGGPRRKFIEAMLRNGLDTAPAPPDEVPSPQRRSHEHVRGSTYFDQKELDYDH